MLVKAQSRCLRVLSAADESLKLPFLVDFGSPKGVKLGKVKKTSVGKFGVCIGTTVQTALEAVYS